MTDSPKLPFLPYGRHQIEEDDVAAVSAVLRSNHLTTGPAVSAFENALAEAVGAPHAVACSSGTAALHLSCLAAGIGPGGAVVAPAITFVATANAVRLCGAEVVFADVNPQSGLMEPQHVEAALSGNKHVRAVIPVYLNGQCAAPAALATLADECRLTVIEDACHALGAGYLDSTGTEVAVGSTRHAAMAAFSFHPVKAIAMGEGGAVTVGDEKTANRLRRLCNHGIGRDPQSFADTELAFDTSGAPNPWYYEQTELGLNYRASDIHCALGLSQLAKLERFLARRRALASRYDRLLAPLAPLVRPVPRMEGVKSGWHLYVVLIDFAAAGIDRSALMGKMRESGIGVQVHYIPVPWQPYYRQRYAAAAFPGADAYYRRCLSLPLFPGMGDSDVERVVETLKRLLRQTRNG